VALAVRIASLSPSSSRPAMKGYGYPRRPPGSPGGPNRGPARPPAQAGTPGPDGFPDGPREGRPAPAGRCIRARSPPWRAFWPHAHPWAGRRPGGRPGPPRQPIRAGTGSRCTRPGTGQQARRGVTGIAGPASRRSPGPPGVPRSGKHELRADPGYRVRCWVSREWPLGPGCPRWGWLPPGA